MVAESTLRQYEFRMEKLKRDGIDAFADPKSLFAWFEKNELGASSQKVYLSALKNSDSENFPKLLQDKLNELYEAQNKKDKEQVLTEKQQTNFVKWNSILELQKALAEKTDKTDAEFKQYLVVSLYTLNAPVRADYGEMKVYKTRSKTRTGNELIFGGKNPVFVFRVYKTAKTYGEVSISVSKPLQEVISQWFAHLGKTPTYLLGDTPLNPNSFSVYVAETFKRYLKKDIGISLIRHSYITYKFPSLKSIKQKEDLAMSMLHSRDLQEKYISLKDL